MNICLQEVMENEEVCLFPGALHNNSLSKIWGTDRVNYGRLENKDYTP